MGADDSFPDDLTTLRRCCAPSERPAWPQRRMPGADIADREAETHDQELRHEQFGQSSERGALLDQLELQLADLEANAAQAETAVQMAAAGKITVPSFERRKPARRPLPEHLPRERIVYPVPASCHAVATPIAQLGEDMTETRSSFTPVEGDPACA